MTSQPIPAESETAAGIPTGSYKDWPFPRGPLRLVMIGAAFTFLLFGVVLAEWPLSHLSARIVVGAARASTMSVYVNTLDSPAGSVSLNPGTSTTYVAAAPPGNVSLVQLNFYGPVGETIDLKSVDILSGTKTVVHFGATSLRHWEASYLAPQGTNAQVARFVTSQQGSAIHQAMDIKGASFLALAAQDQDPLRRLTLCFWAGAALAWLSWALVTMRRAVAIVVAVTGACVIGAMAAVADLTGGLAPVGQAVGRATFLGLSTSSNIHAVEAMFLVGALVGLAAAYAGVIGHWLRLRATTWSAGRSRTVRRRPARGAMRRPAKLRWSPQPRVYRAISGSGPAREVTGVVGRVTDRPSPRQPRHRRLVCTCALLTAVLAVVATLTPDLVSNLRSAGQQTVIPSFDQANSVAWEVFAAWGLVPMRDFWYPYGNSLFFSAHPALGAGLSSLLDMSVIAAYAWVFWRISRGSPWRTWAAVMGLLLAEQFLPAFFRYGTGFLVPLAYWAFRQEGLSGRWTGRLIMAVIIGGGLFVEPDPVVYGALGLALTVAVELTLRRREWRRLSRQILVDLAPAALLGVAYLFYVIAMGELNGLLDIYGQSGALIAYSSYPADLVPSVGSLFGMTDVVMWAPPVMLGAGLYLRVTGSGRDLGLARGLLGIAGCSYLMVEKSAVRPIPDQLRTAVLLGALVILVSRGEPLGMAATQAAISPVRGARSGRRGLDERRLPRRGEARRASQGTARRIASLTSSLRYLCVGGCAGIICAAVAGYPGLGALRSGVEHLSSTAQDDIRLALSPGELRSLEGGVFAPARFADFQAEAALASRLRTLLSGSRHGLFVLGDDPMLYVLSHQDPPWSVTAYNASPIADQRRIVSWLNRYKPKVVVFAQAAQAYDGVPSVVRVPLIYQSVLDSYGPAWHMGDYEVLRPLAPGRHPDGPFWYAQLGSVLPLGSVPNAMPAGEPRPGRAGGGAPYLELNDMYPGRNGGNISVPVRYGPFAISINFMAAEGRSRFDIPLSRLWPWTLSHDPVLGGPPPVGWSAKIVHRHLGVDTLY